MEYLHTMVRVRDLDESLDFYCNKLGLVETSRKDVEAGRFTLVFLAAPGDAERARDAQAPLVELTHNWDPEEYEGGRNFGHLAYRVDNIYDSCQRLMDGGVTINRPTASRSNCSRRANRLPRKSLGHRWKTPAPGSRLGHCAPIATNL